MARDDIRRDEFVTPAADTVAAAETSVDRLAPPPEISQGSAPSDELEFQDVVAAPARSKGGLRAMLPSRSTKLVIGSVMVAAIVLFTLIAPFFTQDPWVTKGNPAFAAPNSEHLLGTTKLGNDVFAQLATGGRGSLIVGLAVGLIALVLALFFGVVAGYVGGFTDEALSLITNVMLVIPGLPLMIVISSYIQGRTLGQIIAVLGVTAWAGSAVVLRSQAKSLRNRDYVSAAKVAGERPFRVICVEILPNLLPLLTSQFLFAFIFAILNEAGLSYLGLGPTGSMTWGTMLNEAQRDSALTAGAWWWFIPPGLLIALLGCGLALINFSIDEIINPKLRNAPDAVRNVRKAKRKGIGSHNAPAITTLPGAGTEGKVRA